jgi:hypothetical protein
VILKIDENESLPGKRLTQESTRIGERMRTNGNAAEGTPHYRCRGDSVRAELIHRMHCSAPLPHCGGSVSPHSEADAARPLSGHRRGAGNCYRGLAVEHPGAGSQHRRRARHCRCGRLRLRLFHGHVHVYTRQRGSAGLTSQRQGKSSRSNLRRWVNRREDTPHRAGGLGSQWLRGPTEVLQLREP